MKTRAILKVFALGILLQGTFFYSLALQLQGSNGRDAILSSSSSLGVKKLRTLYGNESFLPKIKEKNPINLTSEISSIYEKEKFWIPFTLGTYSFNISLQKTALFSSSASYASPLIFYTGQAKNFPTSYIRLTLDTRLRTLDGYINMGKKNPTYYIVPEKDPLTPSKHVFYREDGKELDPATNIDTPSLDSCSKLEQSEDSTSASSSEGDGDSIPINGGNGEGSHAIVQLQVLLDEQGGYEGDWEADIHNLAGVWSNEIGGNITVYCVDKVDWPPDWTAFYTISWYIDHDSEVQLEGDVVILLSNAVAEGGVIGEAECPANPDTCTKRGDCWWSLSSSDRADKLYGAHELGHIFGARHSVHNEWTETKWWGMTWHYYTIMSSVYYDGDDSHEIKGDGDSGLLTGSRTVEDFSDTNHGTIVTNVGRYID